MGKKMKLPFLSQSKSLDTKKLQYGTSSSSSSLSPPQWPFASCGNIKTLSFRDKDDPFRTFNSAYLDAEMTNASTESFFTVVSSSSLSFDAMSEDLADPVESSVFRGVRSDRLFFEPEQSCSLLVLEQEQDKTPMKLGNDELPEEMVGVVEDDNDIDIDINIDDTAVVYKESEALSMDSTNPYEDFKRSMEEMVEAHGLKDWQGLEELLGCYLKINGKNNHGYIMSAFVDLLVSLSFTTTTNSSTTKTTTPTTSSSSSSSTTSSLLSTNMNCSSSPCSPFSLPSSSLTTPCLSSLLDHEDHNDNHDDDDDYDDIEEIDDR